jgi:hypothetical protein
MDKEMQQVETGTLDYVAAAALGYAEFALGNPGLFGLMFRTGRLNVDEDELRKAGQAAIGRAVAALGSYYKVDAPMNDAELARQVYALWAFAHGFADLALAGQFGPARVAKELARTMVPLTVRQMFSQLS